MFPGREICFCEGKGDVVLFKVDLFNQQFHNAYGRRCNPGKKYGVSVVSKDWTETTVLNSSENSSPLPMMTCLTRRWTKAVMADKSLPTT